MTGFLDGFARLLLDLVSRPVITSDDAGEDWRQVRADLARRDARHGTSCPDGHAGFFSVAGSPAAAVIVGRSIVTVLPAPIALTAAVVSVRSVSR